MTPLNPQIGMVAAVRNRRGVISAVEPFDGPDGRLHLVSVEYNDGDTPREQSLVWELEPDGGRKLIPSAGLPRVHDAPPMEAGHLLALQRACRWTAALPYVDPDGDGPLDRLPISAPFHGAIQVEGYQLVPLLKALRMPRVSLLLADDVGLGKTIEAGLILTELLLRRRLRRVLIATPASLRVQWRDELAEKFALPFEVVDRDSTTRLRRRMGLDANPWRTHSRIITSYHYLKQPDVLEEFRAAGRDSRDEARLPWDLLIVDEAHNLAPTPFGEESDLCRMLRQVSPLFEHRLFLTATPHNGHTRSFTGLLQMLDPVRFSQSAELGEAQRRRIEDVVVRRLKRKINAQTDPPRFCERRPPAALALRLSPAEARLSAAFAAFRRQVRRAIARGSRSQRTAGNFAVEILGKRLLSGPVAFADSWHRCRAGLGEEASARDDEVIAAARTAEEESADDREAEDRARAASSAIGAWLKPLADDVGSAMEQIDRALADLGLDAAALPAAPSGAPAGGTAPVPTRDSRWDALAHLIEERLRSGEEGIGDAWRDDERLVVFTEYVTTLDYLVHRLRSTYEEERVLSLYGGMSDAEREPIKAAFNDPDDPVRVLVATDAASEGLNLQQTARYLLHWDVPWNPARLEQRNGRLDRHGQARDVSVWHFVSDDDHDLEFLSYVVGKVDTIREDLGATGEVFDEITHRRLVEGEDLAAVRRDLDRQVEAARSHLDLPADDRSSPEEMEEGAEPGIDLEAIRAELDLGPRPLRQTLEAALPGPPPRLEPVNGDGRWVVRPTPGADWEELLDDTLSLPAGGGLGPRRRAVAFDPEAFLRPVGPRRVFRPRRDTALLHLAHPLVERALASLARLRFPGAGEASRWALRRGEVPAGADAVLLLTVEELAVNDLRETFHHWIRTVRLPARSGELGEPLDHLPASRLHDDAVPAAAPSTQAERARELWIELEEPLRDWVAARAGELTATLRAQLAADRERAGTAANERFRSRRGEVSALIEQTTLERLEREIAELKRKRRQGFLPEMAEGLDALDRDLEQKQAELSRRRRHYEEIRAELQRESERILEHVIPNRYALRGEAHVLPVAVEIVFPAEAS